MPFGIREIELTAPLPALATEGRETGLALVLRLRGRPVGFAMRDLPPGTRLPETTTRAWIASETRLQLVVHALRRERAGRSERARSMDRPAPSHARPLTVAAGRPAPSPVRSLSIAICTRDRPALLERCLRSLESVREDARLDVEVLVVGDAPPDGRALEVVRAFPGARYVTEARPALGRARNRALREAGGDVVAYLDDEVVVDGGWLDGLLEAVREHPDAAAVTGLVLPAELATDPQILFEKRGGLRCGFEKRRFRGPVMPGLEWYPCAAGHFGTGANMAFRREVLLDLGGFDEALDAGAPYAGGGDLDMFYRIVRAGHPLVYEPAFLVFHRHRRTRRELRHEYRRRGSGYTAFLAKSHGWDREMRGRHRRVLLGWFQDRLQRLVRSVRRREIAPPDLVAAELWGGVVGRFTACRRSSRRMRRIMERHA